MKASQSTMFLGVIFAAFGAALLVIGSPVSSNRKPAPPRETEAAAPKADSVSAGGFTLASVNVTLPDDPDLYPDGPNVDVINANCLACHSASMALYQPRLSADQWHKEVEKMRNTFGAPVAEEDVPAIVAYLTAMSGKLPAEAQAAE